MTVNTATEQAYKNGYERGYEAGKRGGVVHGRWEDMSSKYDKGMDLRCSVCGNRADKFVGGLEDWYCLWKPNYCPNCGAKMDL